jgi:hypothetical protein
VKGTKTQTSKKEGKELKKPDTTGNMKGNSGGYLGRESARERKMMAIFLDVESRREKTGIGWNEGKEGAVTAHALKLPIRKKVLFYALVAYYILY